MTPSNSQDAPTPRTTAAYNRFWKGGLWSENFANFARSLECELAHVAAQTATLEREVAELRKDRERLDWLERNGVSLDYDPGFPAIGHESATGPEPGQPESWGAHKFGNGLATRDTLRETIDEASAALTRATPSKEKEKL